MATHKKKRPGRNPLGVFLVLAVLALSVFGGSSPALADDQPTGEETSTVTDTSAPRDDSSSEAPVAPKAEESSDDASVKVETPKSTPSEEESKSELSAPVKEEAKTSSNNTPKPDKITICHRTASYSNPYTSNSVAQSSVDGDGGNDHGQGDHFLEHTGPVFYPEIPKHTEWGDIIPPIPGVHNGLNWTEAGQAIYNNGCEVPAEPKCVESIDTKDVVAKYTTDQYNASVEYKGEKLCDGVSKTVSLNSYDTEGPTWETSGDQDFLGHDQFTVDADHTSGTLTVPAANCFYQTDLYWGSTRYDGVDGALPHYPDSPTPAGLIDHRNGGQACENPPEKIAIPEQPTFEDPCGPDNANWNVPVDTDTLDWENNEGNLTVTIIKDNVTFTDGTTTHDFGIAPDSGEECGEEPGLPDVTVNPVCGAVNVINDEDESLQGWLFDPSNGSDEGQPFTVEAGKSKEVKTTLTDVSWYVYFDVSQRDHKGLVKVPQNCDTPSHGIGTPTSLDRLLPDTGGSNLGLLVLGGALVIAGGGTIFATRRRMSHV